MTSQSSPDDTTIEAYEDRINVRQFQFAACRLLEKASVAQKFLRALPVSEGRVRSILYLSNDDESAANLGEQLQPFEPALQLRRLHFAQARSHLGLEYDWVIYDVYSGINPNLLLLVLGWIRGGGGLLLLGPPLHLWRYFSDPETPKLSSIAAKEIPKPSRFNLRLRSFISDFSGPINRDGEDAAGRQAAMRAAQSRQVSTAQAISEKLLTGASGIHLLSGLRGRGKSTTLGQVISALLVSGKRCQLAAPTKRSVYRVFEQCDGEQQKALQFAPLYEVLQAKKERKSPTSNTILFIDEAAALPIYQIKACLVHFKQIVLTTTLEGYEGTSAGFARKVLPLLYARKDFYHHHLHSPLRWPEDDPLELWSTQLFANAQANHNWPEKLAQSPDTSLGSPVRSRTIRDDGRNELDAYEIKSISQRELLADEALLSTVFSLLSQAHYQTSPNDLRFILDAPKIKIFLLQSADRVLGVCLVCEEGPWDRSTVQRVSHGKRRFKGDFFPQSWVIASDFPELASLHAWRIMRIAILPAYERCGLGSALISHVEGAAHAAGAGYCGAYFGYTSGLLRFWRQLGYRPCQLGKKRDHVSGELAISCVKLLKPSKRIQRALRQFNQDLAFSLAREHRQISPESALQLLVASVPSQELANAGVIEQRDQFAIASFIAGGRSAISIRSNIEALLRVCLFDASLQRVLNLDHDKQGIEGALACLLAFSVQGWGWSELQAYFNLSGQKAVQERLRRALHLLLVSLGANRAK